MASNQILASVGRKGLSIPLSSFKARIGGEVQLRKFLKALTIVEKIHPGCPRGIAPSVRRAYILGSQSEDILILPRIKGIPFLQTRTKAGLLLIDGLCESINNEQLPVPRRVEAERFVTEEILYDYQEVVINFMCGDDGPFNQKHGPLDGVAYLQMDTGLGKTRIGCGIIAALGEPALIVVPTDALATQWFDELSGIYPLIKVEVFHNPPKKSRKIPPNSVTHDIVIIIVNTFRDKTPEFMEGYGTVIFDEAHEYHSIHNSRALWLAQTRNVLGLSATPLERKDGLDKYVQLHLGPIIDAKSIPGFDISAINFRGEVRAIEYAGHPDYCETAISPMGMMSAIMTIGNIIKDPDRTKLIVSEIERLYNLHETSTQVELDRLGLGSKSVCHDTVRRHGVFVFAEHRDYLITIRAALCESCHPDDIIDAFGDDIPCGQVKGVPISILRGGVAKNAVSDARRAKSHIVLTTYGFSRRGISLPDMTSIVLATPRRNGLNQIIGRILRRGSDESIIRQIVDIIDIRTGLRGQFSERRKVYAEKKYPVMKISASSAGTIILPADDVQQLSMNDYSIDELFDVCVRK